MTTKDEIRGGVERAFSDIYETDDWGGRPFTFTLADFDIVGEDELAVYLRLYGWSYSDDDVTIKALYDKCTGKFFIEEVY